MTAQTQVGRLVGFDRTGLDRYAAEVFAPLRRADQRRVARDYLNGLLLLSGRRSARRIATAADRGLSDAAVQQFVNHSPWPDGPVRQRVHARLAAAGSTQAWVLDEVAFGKHGRWSPGVDRQYSTWTGASADQQVGIALSVLTDDCAAPVGWRLALPPSWDADQDRRRRARVPDMVRSRPFWQHAVDLLDDLVQHWQVPAAPVLADLRGRPGVDLMLDALEARGLDYVLRVDPDLEVLSSRCGAAGGGLRSVSGRRPGGLTATTLTELARPAAARRRSTVLWTEGAEQRSRRSQFVSLPVDLVAPGDGLVPLSLPERPLILVVDWPAGRAEPAGAWLTTLSQLRLGELVGLGASGWRSVAAITELGDRFGLFDHEGRTFAGWHHHLTLAGAGYVFALERARSGRTVPGPAAAERPDQARVLLSNTNRRSPSAT